jgi:hypothetical protein
MGIRDDAWNKLKWKFIKKRLGYLTNPYCQIQPIYHKLFWFFAAQLNVRFGAISSTVFMDVIIVKRHKKRIFPWHHYHQPC